MNIKDILRWIVIAGIFAIPFTFFYVPASMFFPFITGKNFAFRIIIEIIFALWIVLALLDRRYAPKRSPILWAFAGFVAVSAVADFFGVSPFKSFWSNYERMEGLVAHLHFFAYFLVASTVFAAERLWNVFLKLLVGASLIMVGYCLLQLSGKLAIHQGGVRLDGTLGNAAYLAIYMLVHMFIAALLFARAKLASAKWFYAIAIALQGYVLYHTATRGTVLGLIAGAFVAAAIVALWGREYPKARKASIAVTVGAVVLVAGFFAVRNAEFVRTSPVLSRFSSISLTEKTTKSRFMVWNMAWQGFLERPVIGWGHENFNYVFNKFYDPRMYDQEQWFDRTHNVFLDWLIAGRILGLGTYLALFGLTAWSFLKKSGFSLVEKSVQIGLLVGYFVHNLFVFDSLTSYFLFFTIAAYAYFVETGGDARLAGSSEPLLSRDAIWYGAAPAVGITLALGLYFMNIRPIEANLALVQGLANVGNPSMSLGYYREALSYDTFGNAEAVERMLEAAPDPSSQLDDGTKAAYVSFAAEAMKRQLAVTPKDARLQLFMASFFNKENRPTDALPHAEAALEASPKKQPILTELGVTYLALNDPQKALDVFRRAYELETANFDAKMIYAVGAIYAGNVELAKSILADVSPDRIVHDDRLLSAYANAGQYADALDIWKARLAENENNLQGQLSTAATYLKLGNRAGAIEHLEAAKKIAPDEFKQQVQKYIDDVRAGKDPTQ